MYNYVSVVEALLALRQRVLNGDFPDTGICEASGINSTLLADAFKEWPEFSGRHRYPIGQTGRDAEYLYCHIPDYFRDPNLSYFENETEWYWSERSPYGRKRRELLDWLITYFDGKC